MAKRAKQKLGSSALDPRSKPKTTVSRPKTAAKNRQLRERIATNQRADSPTLLLDRSMVSGYEAANSSELRGMIYWRQDGDTRRELNSYSDQEIRRKVHFLYGNTGIAPRIVNGAAKLLGYLTPQPICQDRAWNREALNIFRARAGSRSVFDRKGRHNFFSMQPALNRDRFKDGRVLSVLTKSESGAGRVVTYEAHQIKNPPTNSAGFEEGVKLDDFDLHLGYALQDGKNAARFRTIDARDAIYYANWHSTGRIHGLSILAHAVPNLIDVVELRASLKKQLKTSDQTGIVVEQQGTRVIQLPGGGIVGPMVQAPVEAVTTTADEEGNVTETKETRSMSVEQAFGYGGMARLQPGQTVKLLQDQRPSQNRMEFERSLIEDCILGTNLPPSALYYIAGMTGPSVRHNMNDVQRWIRLEHQAQIQWCQMVWAYVIACEIAAGRLRMPMDERGNPEPYWRLVEWIPLPDPTIDVGREGNLAIARLQAGLTTWDDEYSSGGGYAPEKLFRQVDRFAEVRDYAASKQLSMAEVFPLFGKSTAVFQDNVTTQPQYEQAEEPLPSAA